jgi:hypothetical protein
MGPTVLVGFPDPQAVVPQCTTFRKVSATLFVVSRK